MSNIQYYEHLKTLAHQVRQDYQLSTKGISLSSVRKIYREEKIKIDFWEYPLKKVRGAYFPNGGDPCVLIAKGKTLPKEPKLFILLHELKHHFEDAESIKDSPLTCQDILWSDKSPIEIGAGIFAAEFIYPEEEMLHLLRKMNITRGKCEKEDVVRLKRICPAEVSYSFLVKRLEWFKIVEKNYFRGVKFKSLEWRMFGKPPWLQ